MPADVRKTNLLTKLGGRVAKAHEAHKNDETKYGMQDLPSGIKGGIARLAMCKLDEYKEDKPKKGIKKGDVYAVFRGVAISPVEHAGVRVKGQGVLLSIPLTDTKKGKNGETPVPFEENWANFLNELRKFGIDTTKIPKEADKVIDSILLSLEKSKPLFRYSTRGWTPDPTPAEPKPSEMVFVDYGGVISAEEAEIAAQQEPTAGFAAPQGSANDGHNDVPDGAISDPDFDLISVAAEAEKGDPQAIENIKEEARKHGITDDEIENSTSWDNTENNGTSLRELIEAKITGGDAETVKEPESDVWTPKVGATCNYQIKAGGKVHQVKVDKLHKDGTCDLSNIADKGKTKYLAVKQEKLSAA